MANQHLEKKSFKIPEEIIKLLKSKIASYENSGGDKSISGYTRLKNLTDSGVISYSNMYFIKDVLEKNKGNSVYYLNGGETFEKWINDTLNIATTNVANHKKAKQLAGQENAYIKPHDKNSAANPTQTTKTAKVYTGMSNLYAESVKKIIITESQYKALRLLIENENEIEQVYDNLVNEILIPVFGDYSDSDKNSYYTEIKFKLEDGYPIYLRKYNDFLKLQIGRSSNKLSYPIDSSDNYDVSDALKGIWKTCIYLSDFPMFTQEEFKKLDSLAANGLAQMAFHILIGRINSEK